MSHVPVFVSAGDDRVAAVVTLPDGAALGVVIVLAGTGRHNAIGSTLAARLSERLAEHRLATVRLDYAGSGDSPGIVAQWTPAEIGAATAQARAALDVARDAAGVRGFAAVGTCFGSRVALSLVGDEDCLGAVCLAPPILDFGGLGRMGRRVRDRRLGALVRSNAALRRVVVGPLRRVLRARKPAGPLLRAFAALDRAQLVFLYGERSPLDDHLGARARRTIDAAVARLAPGQRARFELRMVPSGPLTTFDGLSPEEQSEVLDVVLPYATRLFGAGQRIPPAREHAVGRS